MFIYISKKKELNLNNNPFHYRKIINNPNISLDVKKDTLYGLATKIEKENVYYSCLTINKKKLDKNFYYIEMANTIKKYFIKLLYKLTNNNKLNITINYDKGQNDLFRIISEAVYEFSSSIPNRIRLTSERDDRIANHGYADFLGSIEKVKIKKQENSLGKVEKELYADDDFYGKILKMIEPKNIDNIEFDNFEKLFT